MGLHNLPSRGLADMMDELSGRLGSADETPWYESLISMHSQIPTAPGSDVSELLGHLLTAFRGFRHHFARSRYLRSAEILLAVIEKNKARRGAIFIELVEAKSLHEAQGTWTVWKGTLFETRLPQTIVCWHPDKDFEPVEADHILRTGHSELGRARRRRQTAATLSTG